MVPAESTQLQVARAVENMDGYGGSSVALSMMLKAVRVVEQGQT